MEGYSINNDGFKQHKDSYLYAIDKTEKEVYQAVEGLYHNLNTLQSRSGNQLPFTSINYGTCTEPEGRMVTKALLEHRGCILIMQMWIGLGMKDMIEMIQEHFSVRWAAGLQMDLILMDLDN